MTKFFDKLEAKAHELFHRNKHEPTQTEQASPEAQPVVKPDTHHRFDSFAPQTTGHAKWYVDGCSYFWALSEAIESAQTSIYILDWWLSPELYLRRPPAANEQYRLDRMLKAAADRGVQVRVLVYKEVEAALTLNSEHTKKVLEALSSNIQVFRHPDHAPSGTDIRSTLHTSFEGLTLKSIDIAKLKQDTLTALYGQYDDAVLFWAHHEKLCIVDNTVGFMGGLDACFGRWDTNSHPIADVHPGDLNSIIFPGQDYNNARIYDFAGVDKWEQNQLDRQVSSRMGWSDISISLSGHIVNSLVFHFTDRWNYVYNEKYNTNNPKYTQITSPSSSRQVGVEGLLEDAGEGSQETFGGIHHHFAQRMRRMVGGEQVEAEHSDRVHIQLTRSCSPWSSGHPVEKSIQTAYIDAITNAEHFVYIENQFFITATGDAQKPVENMIGAAIVGRIIRAHQAGEAFRIIVLMPAVPAFAGDLQSDGALGTRAIMEFQYNSICRGGHSIMEKIAQAGIDPQQYICFYNLRNFDRINNSSTMAQAESKSGVPYEAARREFDDSVEAGYDGYAPNDDTQGQFDASYQQYQDAAQSLPNPTWDTVSSTYMAPSFSNSSSKTTVKNSLSSIPWTGTPESELSAFVTEELYIHTKILIADDRLAIIGSANLNDRSQLGSHDSEIAVIIEDPDPIESTMSGKPYTVSKFAASLRRQIFRKHIGLLPDQKCDSPTQNFSPVTGAPNEYDWDSEYDRLVADPLSEGFDELWREVARTNTETFSRAFHNVPNDKVRSWKEYDEFFTSRFVMPVPVRTNSGGGGGDNKDKTENDGKASEVHQLTEAEQLPHEASPHQTSQDQQGKVPYGHVIKEEFPGGVDELKEWLGRVRGNLVEMPLQFLVEVQDLAKQGLSLNPLTETLYT